jgi:hypothetical protein
MKLRQLVPLAGVLAVVAGCDPLGESTLEIENTTSYDLSITAVKTPDLPAITAVIPKGEIFEIDHDADVPNPPPPESFASLHADVTVDGTVYPAYTQDPVDAKRWQQWVWPGPCNATKCVRYVLVLTDDDLTLPVAR